VREEAVRVDEPEGDEVVLVALLRQERAGVVDDHIDVGVVVGVLGMQRPPEPGDDRIDLHGVDVCAGRVAQRGGHVVARAGAEHEYSLRCDEGVRQVVQPGPSGDVLVARGRPRRQVERLLMAVLVDGDVAADGLPPAHDRARLDLVVRGPAALDVSLRGVERDDADRGHRAQHGDRERPGGALRAPHVC
jgi:hypothetical protein